MENKSKANNSIDAIQRLIEQLQSADDNSRDNASSTLRDIIDEKKFPESQLASLIPLTQHPDAQVAEYAVWLLGRIGTNEVLQPLLQSLNHNEADVRLTAAEALGNFNDTEVIQVLIKLLDDVDDNVRFTAADSLGHLKAIEAFDDLLRLLQDKNEDVRVSAIFALGDIGEPKALPQLQWLAENDFAYVPDGGLKVSDLAKRAIKEIMQKQNNSAKS